MELSALRSFTAAFSLPGSSASSASTDTSRSSHHRCEHGATLTRTPDPTIEEDARDGVNHRHFNERHTTFEQQQQRHQQERHHTSLSLVVKRINSPGTSSRKGSDELSLASTCDDQPRVDVHLDKETISLENHTQNKQEQEQVRDQVICMIFDLPGSTQFYQDFSCAIASTLAMHGRMYPTSSHVCFYSNVFGRERKILIPYEAISEIHKTTTMVFQHAIRLITFDKDEYTFTSFWGNNRDSCCDLILKTRDRVLAELRFTAAKSSDSHVFAPQTSRVLNDIQSPSASWPSSQDSSDALEQSEDEEHLHDNEKASDDQDNVAKMSNDNPIGTCKDSVAHDQTRSVFMRRLRAVSDVDSIAPKEDISMMQIYEEDFPVSVDTFMQLFVLDNASFGLDKFNEQMGSTEITVNPWTTPIEDDKSFGMTRSLQFRIPIEAPIGPKSSHVNVLQCLIENTQGVRIVESSTRLVDIPYGDYFSVEERWTVAPQASNPNACKILIELKVIFGKFTLWKNTIESRAINDNRTKWKNWVDMAKEFLSSMNSNKDACDLEECTPTSSLNSDRAVVQDAFRKDYRSMKHRSKPSHRHRNSVDAVMPCEGARTHMKVFPWVLVLLLALVILRLQLTLSSIEHSLLLNTERIGDLTQLIDVKAQSCPPP